MEEETAIISIKLPDTVIVFTIMLIVKSNIY